MRFVVGRCVGNSYIDIWLAFAWTNEFIAKRIWVRTVPTKGFAGMHHPPAGGTQNKSTEDAGVIYIDEYLYGIIPP